MTDQADDDCNTGPKAASNAGLRDRIAAALYERERPPRDPHWADVYAMDREVFEAMADAALDVIHPIGKLLHDVLGSFDGMRNSDNTGDIQHWQARVTPREYSTWKEAARAAGPTTAGAHVYLSTGCLHGDHDYCKSMTGLNGAKRPGSCKHCGAKCICNCHEEPGPT
jgi:hypothetical protein